MSKFNIFKGDAEVYADFILADRKRVLDEVEKPLREQRESCEQAWKGNRSEIHHSEAIDEALQTIHRLKGEA